MEFKIHNHLCPKIFDLDKKIKSNIREKLLKIAYRVIDDLEEDVNVEDITLTGSVANYNYTDESDIDLHIIFDFKQINKDKELVKKALDCNKFVWNMRHNIFIDTHEIEVYYQDSNEPHTSTGVYSLIKNEWLVEPKKYGFDVKVDKELIVKKIKNYISFIKLLERDIEYHTTTQYASKINSKATMLHQKLKADRKESLESEGEMGDKNLVFKYLRRKGYIDKLVDIIDKSYDKALAESTNIMSLPLPSKEPVARHRRPAANTGFTRKNPSFVPDKYKADLTDFAKLQNIKNAAPGTKSPPLSPSEFQKLKKFGIGIIVPGTIKHLKNLGIKIYFDPTFNAYVMEKE